MSDDGNFNLLLAFDREGEADEPFAMGFECGRLWEMAKANEDEFSQTVHAENAEMVLRIGEALGREVRSEDLNDEWIEVTFDAA
jgi:hypothetical protein